MSYDHHAIAVRVEALLHTNPRLTLPKLSRELQIDRHTIERAMKTHFHQKFGEVKAAILDAAIAAALASNELTSIKQTAAKAGFGSASSLAKRTRRTLGLTPGKVRRRRLHRRRRR